jgi:Protein of unknown function (DUF3311)
VDAGLGSRRSKRKHNTVISKPPSILSLLLALIPFTAICFSVSLWDHVYPFVFGLPFNLAWLLGSIITTPIFMWFAYRIEDKRDNKRRGDEL